MLSARKPGRTICILIAALTLAVWLLPTGAAFAVSIVDVYPGWQNAGTDGFDCWGLYAGDTSSTDDFKFQYGDGGYSYYYNVGAPNWSAFPCRGFGVQCVSRNFYQRLDHLNGPAYDTSTTYVPGSQPC